MYNNERKLIQLEHDDDDMTMIFWKRSIDGHTKMFGCLILSIQMIWNSTPVICFNKKIERQPLDDRVGNLAELQTHEPTTGSKDAVSFGQDLIKQEKYGLVR